MRTMFAIKPSHATRLVLMLGAALVLGGCTRGMSDLRDWVAQEKQAAEAAKAAGGTAPPPATPAPAAGGGA